MRVGDSEAGFVIARIGRWSISERGEATIRFIDFSNQQNIDPLQTTINDRRNLS